MAQSKILHRALGKVKDQTSIGVALVSSSSSSISALDVAIVKATRHEEKPPSEKHLKEIMNLTYYSGAHLSACVSALFRRLRKTRNWTVAVKTLMVIHRLVSRGDLAYGKEIFFFTTRGGERLLGMSEYFRDNSSSNSWDFTTFVRRYAQYIDMQLEFRMEGQLKYNTSWKSRLRGGRGEEKEAGDHRRVPSANACLNVHDMNTEEIFTRSQQLQKLIERFLSCQPEGKAKSNRLVFVALQSMVQESFEIYFHMTQIISVLIDRFMELEVADCRKVSEIFRRAAKQFNELDSFYSWCKDAGVARSSNYPQVEKINLKKLIVMDEFIREKVAMAHAPKAKKREEAAEEPKADEGHDLLDMKALPASGEATEKEEEGVRREESAENCTTTQVLEVDDLLDLSCEDHVAIKLFTDDPSTPPLTWERFGSHNDQSSDWELALVESASSLSNEKTTVSGGGGGGGSCFDMSLLDNLYQQGSMVASHRGISTSDMILNATAAPAFLALPTPPASPAMQSPAYVQMWDVDRKQQLEQQLMWQQYVNNGMHGYNGWQQPALPHGW